MSSKPPGQNLKSTSGFLQYSSMGLQMMLTIAVFVLGGVYADRWLGMVFPVFTVLLSLAGVGGSIYYVMRKLM